MSTTQIRQPQGKPTGGQFAATARPKPSADALGDGGGSPCTSCGQVTKRHSGLCRRCDPVSRPNRTAGLERDAAATSIEE